MTKVKNATFTANREYFDVTAFGDTTNTYLVNAKPTAMVDVQVYDVEEAQALHDLLHQAWINHVSVGAWLPPLVGLPDEGDVFIKSYEMRVNARNLGVVEYEFMIEIEFA